MSVLTIHQEALYNERLAASVAKAKVREKLPDFFIEMEIAVSLIPDR
ncbi:hypothetical protein [Rhodopirellula sp. SWK7]|nr:hypothetical protein [Rhodopirellula sp. SWK7]